MLKTLLIIFWALAILQIGFSSLLVLAGGQYKVWYGVVDIGTLLLAFWMTGKYVKERKTI